MIGEALEFGHQGAQIGCARRRLDFQRGLDRPRESEAVGDGAVAGDAGREPRRLVERRSRYQRLDALVRIAEALLEPNDRFAVGGETEMAGLDDAGVHWSDRNLVQALALGGQKGIRRRLLVSILAGAERAPRAPASMVKPWPRVRKTLRDQPVKVMQGAFEPDRRRVQRADRGKRTSRTFDRHDGDLRRLLVEHGHVSGGSLAPQAKQRQAAGRQLRGHGAPARLAHHDARPGAMSFDFRAINRVGQGHRAIRAAWRRSGTRKRAPAVCRRPRSTPAPDGRTLARRRPSLRPWRRAARRTRRH